MGTAADLHRPSPFAVLATPTTDELETQGPVRYVIVSGRQDDGVWGPVGAVWISEDRERGGFVVSPWAPWHGSECVRGYRGALERGWTPAEVFGYWQREVWPRGYTVDRERRAESFALLFELVTAL